jgi:hypothetical protein
LSAIQGYKRTEFFRVANTIGVPHPFVVTGSLVSFVAKKWGGVISDMAIADFEKKRMKTACGYKDCNLMHGDHKTVLLISCKSLDQEMLREYLATISDQAQKEGFGGFAFWDETEVGEK